MKKLFTLIAAALMAVGANAQTEKLGFAVDQYPWNYETTGTRSVAITGEISVNANSQWGEYKLTNKSLDLTVYKGFIVEYSDYVLGTADIDGNQGFQLKIEGDPKSLNTYSPLEADATVLEGDFKDETGTITTFNLQAKAKDAKVVIKKVTWVKRDGTTEDAAFGGKFWGVDVTGEQETVYPAALPMSITYKGQYGGLEIVGEDGSHQTYANDGENADVYDYVIEFEEATTGPLMIELDDEKSGFNWLNYDAGVTEIKFTISPETCGQSSGEGDAATFTAKNLAKIYMKAPSADATYPYTIKVQSVTRTKQGADEGGEESTSMAINYAEMKAGDFTVENATKNTTESTETKNVYDIKGGEELQFTLNTAPDVVFTITNGNDKQKVFIVNVNDDETTDKGSVEFGGKNGVVIFKDAKVDDVIKMVVAAKGGTAATIGVLPSSGNDLIETTKMTLPKKDKENDDADAEGYVWKEFSFTVTEDMIKTLDGVKVVRVKETAGGYRCKAISINADLPTGIQSVKAADTKSVNGAIYNLAGQKVNETYKGIVIKDGKKYIQK